MDYSRSPDTTRSAAIDPIFDATSISNEAGQSDFPFYWSSTTHASFQGGQSAAYVAFGRSLGYMNNKWVDVHGAGSQRSDPKTGDTTDYPTGRGPQGDAIRIYNYARCVAGGTDGTVFTGGEADQTVGSGRLPPMGEAQELGGQPSLGIQSGQGDQPGKNGTPPQEAIDACVNLDEGTDCSVVTPNGTLSGTCAN